MCVVGTASMAVFAESARAHAGMFVIVVPQRSCRATEAAVLRWG
jgi:hypothetical protein